MSDIDQLQRTVEQTVRSGPLAQAVGRVSVEPGSDAEGNEILRVLLVLTTSDDQDEALETLLEQIETAVLAIDDRYPSVRFLDAA